MSEDFVARPQAVGGKGPSPMVQRLNLLNEKVDKLLHFQEDLTGKLQRVDQGLDNLGKGLHKLSVSQAPADLIGGAKWGVKAEDGALLMGTQNTCSEVLQLMKAVHQDDRERLEKVERIVDSVDKVVKYLAETFKNSKVIDFILKGGVPWKKGTLVEILEEVGGLLLFIIVIIDLFHSFVHSFPAGWGLNVAYIALLHSSCDWPKVSQEASVA